MHLNIALPQSGGKQPRKNPRIPSVDKMRSATHKALPEIPIRATLITKRGYEKMGNCLIKDTLCEASLSLHFRLHCVQWKTCRHECSPKGTIRQKCDRRVTKGGKIFHRRPHSLQKHWLIPLYLRGPMKKLRKFSTSIVLWKSHLICILKDSFFLKV